MSTSHFIQANGLRIHYLHAAAPGKPQLLLLHGLTDAAVCWTPVIEALAGDYDIFAPDARGHGQTDAPERGYSALDHAGDAVAFIHALGLDQPIILGHSMGGMVATVVAGQHPALIRAAIFEDPAWFDLAQMPSPEMRSQRADEWRADLVANQALPPADMIAKRRAADPGWADAEFGPWSVAKQQARLNVLEYIEHAPSDWRALVRAMQTPALLITGDVARGVIISPQQAAEAQSLNPLLAVVNIPNTGHSIRRDAFAGYMDAVRAFLHRVTH
jgi:pimeloyl-ACP methyl ester carboxylesterase